MGLMRHFRTNWLWKETKHPLARFAAVAVVAAFLTMLWFSVARPNGISRWPFSFTIVREVTVPRFAAVFAVVFVLTLVICVLLEWAASRFLEKRAKRRQKR